MKNLFLLSILILCTITGRAQIAATNSGGEVQTVQPKIMVIPYVKEGEDIRTVLEEDVNKRITITKIKEAFDSRGFTTVDFAARLRASQSNSVFSSANKTDIKAQFIQMSGADIYVETEVNVLLSSTGNSVKVIVTAYEISTGNSLSNKVGESGKFYTDDIGKLASKAFETVATDFLTVMQEKFTDIVNNGKSLIIEFGFAEDSQYNMFSEVGTQGLLLSDELDMWMEQNAYKNNYHIQGTSDNLMIFDDVKIPLKDQSTGNNYNPNKFALEIFKFLKTLGLEGKRDIKSNTIFITIK
ncbi:MAG: DUF6175 family protein [Prevotellaceae bacterium]|jgi:hypothetical protein|nr:DUF6175 family protein [Prevotellaceae bacterium]